MKLSFYKYQGAGNDFIMLDELKDEHFFTPDQIATLCHRQKGIGADGLIQLRKDKMSDFMMVYYNSDGHESSMCGNGGRCFAAFARDLQKVDQQIEFKAIDGPHIALINQHMVDLKMKDVPHIEQGSDFFVLDTGSPHFVQFTNDVEDLDVLQMARDIRYNSRFSAQGINVNFVEVVSENYLKIRTYERGVEAETLACGTGVVAAALSYAKLNGQLQVKINIEAQGGDLSVKAESHQNGFKNIWLKGPAIQTFIGEIEI